MCKINREMMKHTKRRLLEDTHRVIRELDRVDDINVIPKQLEGKHRCLIPNIYGRQKETRRKRM